MNNETKKGSLKGLVIAVDFDGTCVTHEYPNIGKSIGAEKTLKRIVEEGGKLILYTMRSGTELEEAEQWFIKNQIPLFGVQKNPAQSAWTKSPKCYASIYIDDAALGCPLIEETEERPYVDWQKVEALLFKQPKRKGAAHPKIDVGNWVKVEIPMVRPSKSGRTTRKVVGKVVRIIGKYAQIDIKGGRRHLNISLGDVIHTWEDKP